MELCDGYLWDDEEGNKKFYVPFVITYKNGSVVAGKVSVGDDVKLSEGMSEAQRQSLKDTYINMIGIVNK